MSPFEKRLAEEVRKYQNLYDTSLKSYKDAELNSNSWLEISQALGRSVPECTKKWRGLRDKFVRVRRKITTTGGTVGADNVPGMYAFLSWLSPHIRHRDVKNLRESDHGGPVDGPAEHCDDECQSSYAPSPSLPVATLLPAFQSSSTVNSPITTMIALPSAVTPVFNAHTPSPSLSAVSHRAQKRQRVQEEDDFSQALKELMESRQLILKQLKRTEVRRPELGGPEDAITHFTKTIGDMLRKVAEEDQDDTMHEIYCLLHGRIKRKKANPTL
ncbi:unnamed protein product [Knipowitschia caucasica]|uniref:MADF domain-containing protein n=1 Tax=Knipowitschia caucasica TaxID=637954 RepID=A0AAV2KR77_KNICA